MRLIKKLILLFLLFLCYIEVFAKYKISDFYSNENLLKAKVDSVFKTLSDSEKVAQMIISSTGKLGKPKNEIFKMLKEKKIGGVVFLKETKENIKNDIISFNKKSNRINSIPLIFSIDGEPSLLNKRCLNTKYIKNTNLISSSSDCVQIAEQINSILNTIGINQNYAPVVDINIRNCLIKKRSFSSNSDSVITFSKQFIKESHKKNIVSTIKHFPGHGGVIGDSHLETVVSNSITLELNVYKELINFGVISVMVGHITCDDANYTSNGYPASLSKSIVTNTLRNDLNFQGLIITDALNMQAVRVHKNAPLLAAKAGNDFLLMPINEYKTISKILDEMKKNDVFKEQIFESVKRILRLKICLNIIE